MEIEEHYHEVRDMLEAVLIYVFHGLEKNCAKEIELVRSVYPSEKFLLPEPGKEVRLTFAEGQKLLREEGPEEFRDVRDDEDMGTAQEKALGALVRKKFNTDFYVLDKFPSSARPFYTMPDPENPEITNAFDFMMRGQEILSGGQRLHLPHGVPPHGGGGIGLDRVVAWYLQLPSVHLACAFPRTPKRLNPWGRISGLDLALMALCSIDFLVAACSKINGWPVRDFMLLQIKVLQSLLKCYKILSKSAISRSLPTRLR
jgi:aspartyl-tRNA synthetase